MKLEGSFSHGIFRIVPPASPLLLGERWNDKEAAGVENHIYSKMPQRATKGGDETCARETKSNNICRQRL